MKKFTITATLTIVKTITKTMEETNKNKAKALLLTKYPSENWETDSVLKTTSR